MFKKIATIFLFFIEILTLPCFWFLLQTMYLVSVIHIWLNNLTLLSQIQNSLSNNIHSLETYPSRFILSTYLPLVTLPITSATLYFIYLGGYFLFTLLFLFLSVITFKNPLTIYQTCTKKINQQPATFPHITNWQFFFIFQFFLFLFLAIRNLLLSDYNFFYDKFLLSAILALGFLLASFIKISSFSLKHSINKFIQHLLLNLKKTLRLTTNFFDFFVLLLALGFNFFAIYESQKNNFHLQDSSAILYWLLSLVLLVTACWDIEIKFKKIIAIITQFRFSTECIAALFTVGIFFILAMYKLSSIPAGFHADESIFATEAQKILNHSATNLFATGSYGNTQIIVYLLALGMYFLGSSIEGMRTVGIILCTTCCGLLFILVKNLFSQRTAFLTLILLITSPLMLQISKLVLATYTTFCAFILVFFCYLLCLKKNNNILYIVFGFSLGISIYTYFASRIIPFLFLCLFFLFEDKHTFIPFLKKFSLVVLAAIMITSPHLYYLSKHLDQFGERTKTVLLFTTTHSKTWINKTFSEENPYQFHTTEKNPDPFHIHYVLYQIKRSFLFPFSYKDFSNQYGFDHTYILNPLLVIFFIYGLTWFVKKIFKLPFFSILFICFFTILVGSTLTIETPTYNRLVGILPCMYLITAVGMIKLYQALPWQQKVKNILGISILTGVIGFNLANYFIIYNQLDCGFRQSKPLTSLAYYMKEHNQYHYYLYNVPRYNLNRETLDYIAGTLAYTEITSYASTGKDRFGRSPAFVFLPDQKDIIATLRKDFPQGTLEEKTCPACSAILWYYIFTT